MRREINSKDNRAMEVQSRIDFGTVNYAMTIYTCMISDVVAKMLRAIT